ncbi:MAG TPA: hypothetical protein VNA23_03575 [Anaerolineales bacterium]|nr:hypothetical protein [Anaerolineales bacterium]
MTDTTGDSGEFSVTRRARFIEDAELPALAVSVTPYHPVERYILFEFEVESVLVTEYKGDETIRTRWKVDE